MKKQTKYISILLATLLYTGCSSSSADKNVELAETYDATKAFASQAEFKRLWYFKALNMGDSQEALGYNGAGVNVTIMGEAVDASHPDLTNRITKQYNTFAHKGKVLAGEGNQPYGFDKMGYDDGHGTHIAGTIAAECNNKGIQGVACGAKIAVYDIGAYDSSEKFDLQGWAHNDDEFKRFIYSFSTALDDVTKQGKSKITTGSFNIEAPYFPFKAGGVLDNLTINQIMDKVEDSVEDIDTFLSKNFVEFSREADKATLKDILGTVDDEQDMVLLEMLLPKSQEWKALEESVQRYQKSGGVYIVTESNNIFHRTSVLNAMPTISDKVDKDLWISAVLIKPKTFDEATSREDIYNSMKGQWDAILNDCGQSAKEYCVLIPSYQILSTMTQKVRDPNARVMNIDGQGHQIYTGHSMGAPMIAGTLALMQEKNSKNSYGYSMKELVKILKQSANRTFKGYDENKHGRGILDVRKALTAMER